MKGLLIEDEFHWHDRWSSELGQRLSITDSSNNLFIFDEACTREEILSVIRDVPRDLYRIFDLQETSEEYCDFMADSGTCYRKIGTLH
ncbi:MAG: hypothetical protein C0617_05770 [Desulfuromonas sp.]|uniref:hypothetical protein n=1 Tax=Desulfuromonas sp. TaxID=892 RepID=UPI000CAD9EBD|nr:hypothetical protein [Desulfuromonas sp.]PLX85191.1 MAG: hypothetical protein C0617_05770 [Desulfuromonas sp.]